MDNSFPSTPVAPPPRHGFGPSWRRFPFKGEGVRAVWQEWRKRLALLHRIPATPRGSAGGLLHDVARADGARAELVRHLAADIGEGLLDRRHGRAEHRLAVL